MGSKVLENLTALKGYAKSIGCALIKAGNGSDVEDGYVMEKLEAFARRMGYELVKTETVRRITVDCELWLAEDWPQSTTDLVEAIHNDLKKV